MIKLMTTFNGRPAPGGMFDPTTKTYYKACRSQNGGQHPHRYDYGGIDDPIVQRLKALECKIIILELPGGTFEIPFQIFLKCGYSQRWNDPRFTHARWYCQARHWNSDYTEQYEAPTTRQAEQASLFGASELQDLALSGRLAR